PPTKSLVDAAFPFPPFDISKLVSPTAASVIADDFSRDAAVGIGGDVQILHERHARSCTLWSQIGLQLYRHIFGGVHGVGIVFVGLDGGVVDAGGLADSGEVTRRFDDEVVPSRVSGDLVAEADGSVQVYVLTGGTGVHRCLVIDVGVVDVGSGLVLG